MSLVAPLQGHFDGGEISALLQGRVDADRYKSSLALCKNWIPTLQGALLRRPGSEYIGSTKDGTVQARLIPFIYSTTQAYMLEFGNNYIRFWANYGEVISGGTPYEISSPYASSDLSQIKYTQSADTLYLVHPDKSPMKLMRFAHTNWQLRLLNFQDGPYGPINLSQISLQPTAVSGTNVSVIVKPVFNITGTADNGSGFVRITAAGHGWAVGDLVVVSGVVGTTEANGTWRISAVSDSSHFDIPVAYVHAYTSGGQVLPAGADGHGLPQLFGANLIGCPIRILTAGTQWGWGYITGYGGGASQIFVNVIKPFQSVDATTTWRIGAWKPSYTDATGATIPASFPSTVAFHEDRLVFSGARETPQRLDASVTSDYENFAPTLLDGTVKDNSALNFSLNSNDVNLIEWLNSEERGLVAGSVSGEWAVRPSLTSEALTPTNISAKRSTRWGSANMQAAHVGKATVFVQRGSRRVKEFMYFFDIDGYRSTDLTELAEHITGTGVTDMAYQAIPHPIVWFLRKDGTLAAMTYDRDMSQLRVGWHQHVLGGQSDVLGTPPVIESIAVIPSPDGTRDDVWMIVKRYINGVVTRYVEVLTKVFEDIDNQSAAFHVDCGATYDNPITITGMTAATPVVVTAPSHGLTTGDTVRIDGVQGMIQSTIFGTVSIVNGLKFTITVVDANRFQLNGSHGVGVSVYQSGGTVRKYVTTISGLSYLQNENVYAWADGAVQGPFKVTSGAITLTTPATTVTIGYNYSSDGQLLRFEAGARNGTSIGKTRRTHRAGFMLHRALNFQIGMSFSKMDQITYEIDPGTDSVNGNKLLYSGITSQSLDSDYDFDNQLCFRVSDPSPCTLVAIMPQLQTQDRA